MSDRFLRLPQVLAIIPVSRSAWWSGVKKGIYPQPVKLSERVTVWSAAEIAQFVQKTTEEARS
ncbi:MAG: Prophage CP4-57 regulatory protein (AlpA) [Syntrophorhabdaceae bacterium PtaU1.Bin034]|jgi:predicted DNA-binding transcriptional regulator AlpA|nr:MAG: Prophage CP4-57 regulatory protein (AlpA) [Syntrophorhabdaceae bacterium PtaU1.Bin034]